MSSFAKIVSQFAIIKSQPILQMGFGVTSGDKALIGGEIDKICFRLCHTELWTFLDLFGSRLLQICADFGLVSEILVYQ
jgi:hypothetical protein